MRLFYKFTFLLIVVLLPLLGFSHALISEDFDDNSFSGWTAGSYCLNESGGELNVSASGVGRVTKCIHIVLLRQIYLQILRLRLM